MGWSSPTSGWGGDESGWSRIAAITNIAPVNTVAPAITGSANVGSVLTCSTGTWTGSPTPTYAYQWYRVDTSTLISGATSATYTPISGDQTHTINCHVTATNSAGSATANSNTTAAIGAAGTTTYDAAKKNSVMSLSGGNLIATATSNTSPPAQVETVNGVSSGKYYFEFTITWETGLHSILGLATSTYDATSGLGLDHLGNNCIYLDSGTSFFISTPTTATYLGDISNTSPVAGTTYTFGFAVDHTNKKIYGRRITGGAAARGYNNNAGNPVAGTGGYDYTTGSTATEYPTAQVDLVSTPITINTGGSAYALAAPSGYGNL
jgi:hypothetical protein